MAWEEKALDDGRVQQGEIKLRERVSPGERAMCAKGGGDQGEFRIYRYLEEDAGGDRLGIRGLNTIL